jgi:hypothetical protein
MPLAGPLLGVQLAASAGSIDPAGIAGWLGIAGALVSWTQSNVNVNSLGGTPLVAAGPVITGTGGLIVGPYPVLGLAMAAGAGSVDAAGIAKWTAIAEALTSWMSVAGGINPSTLIAYVGLGSGPVTGTALLSFTGPCATLPAAAGATDPPGILAWTAIALAIQTHLMLGLVTPIMVNPGTGGPVTGTGTVS